MDDHSDLVSRGPNPILQRLFFAIIVRPVMLVILGIHVRRRDRLPNAGPAILVANHNSHLDALALMTLFPGHRLAEVRPVAAADYFLANRAIAWFSVRVLGILPIDRQVRSHRQHPLEPISEALRAGQIVILFPEGTRGEPEHRAPLQRGITHLARRHREVPITPVFLYGLGRMLPRGEGLLVPMICDAFVGEPLHWSGDKESLLAAIDAVFNQSHQQIGHRCLD